MTPIWWEDLLRKADLTWCPFSRKYRIHSFGIGSWIHWTRYYSLGNRNQEFPEEQNLWGSFGSPSCSKLEQNFDLPFPFQTKIQSCWNLWIHHPQFSSSNPSGNQISQISSFPEKPKQKKKTILEWIYNDFWFIIISRQDIVNWNSGT